MTKILVCKLFSSQEEYVSQTTLSLYHSLCKRFSLLQYRKQDTLLHAEIMLPFSWKYKFYYFQENGSIISNTFKKMAV